ncbi:hypothetical protein Ddye_014403, partial [Dipteronia dyeriana]
MDCGLPEHSGYTDEQTGIENGVSYNISHKSRFRLSPKHRLGTPFMSSLELRTMKSFSCIPQSGSLLLYLRLDVGSTTNETI